MNDGTAQDSTNEYGSLILSAVMPPQKNAPHPHWNLNINDGVIKVNDRITTCISAAGTHIFFAVLYILWL